MPEPVLSFQKMLQGKAGKVKGVKLYFEDLARGGMLGYEQRCFIFEKEKEKEIQQEIFGCFSNKDINIFGIVFNFEDASNYSANYSKIATEPKHYRFMKASDKGNGYAKKKDELPDIVVVA